MMALLTNARRRFWMLTAFIVCAIISWQLFVISLPSFKKVFTSGIDINVKCSKVTDDEQNVSNSQYHYIMAEKKQRILQHQKSPDTSRLPKVQSIRCPPIWDGDQGELNASVPKANATEPLRWSLSDYLNKTENCTEYFYKEGFNLASVDKEEESFPLAFSLLVYTDIEQVERLLRAVYRVHNVYCIHADKKSSAEFRAGLRLIVGCLPNVMMTEKSIPVQWGTFSVLEPEIMCMHMLWTHEVKWRYFINLTGQEFPLKSNKELVKILKSFKGANDISGTRHSKFFFRWIHKLPVPYNLTLVKGDVHIVASREFVDYAIHSRVARELLKWVGPTFIPDETFFNTLNYNKQLGIPGSHTGFVNDTIKQTFSRYKIWNFFQKEMCSGIWKRSICQFCLGDLYGLTHSHQLFANKFSYNYCSLAYDCLEEWYYKKVHLENINQSAKLDIAVYENSDLVKQQYTGPVLIWE